MPELAEVEYFRKRWDAGLGKRIVAVQLHGEKRIFRETEARAIEHQLVRQKLLHSVARGKQMLFALSGGNWLGIHLGMSGKLRVEAANFEAGKHDHLVLRQKDRRACFQRCAAIRTRSLPPWPGDAGMVGREHAGNSLPGIHEGLDAGVRQATRARPD